MKAIAYTEYGPPDVLHFTDIEDPIPKDNEVLLKLCAASVNPLDWHCMRGDVRLMGGGFVNQNT